MVGGGDTAFCGTYFPLGTRLALYFAVKATEHHNYDLPGHIFKYFIAIVIHK